MKYQVIIEAATRVITEVMDAGAHQRREGNPDEWMNEDPVKRLHHAFMHLVACKTHQEQTGEPWSLTDNTHLEDYKHALTGLAIVAVHQLGLLHGEPPTVDTTQAEVAGE